MYNIICNIVAYIVSLPLSLSDTEKITGKLGEQTSLMKYPMSDIHDEQVQHSSCVSHRSFIVPRRTIAVYIKVYTTAHGARCEWDLICARHGALPAERFTYGKLNLMLLLPSTARIGPPGRKMFTTTVGYLTREGKAPLNAPTAQPMNGRVSGSTGESIPPIALPDTYSLVCRRNVKRMVDLIRPRIRM